jgi:hypothetical protein
VPLVLHHAAQVVSQAAADGEDREHLEKIRQRVGVLEGMRRVGVRIAAAIGSEHFDGDLRGHRALHDGLFVHDLTLNGERFNELGLRVRLEVLNHAL